MNKKRIVALLGLGLSLGVLGGVANGALQTKAAGVEAAAAPVEPVKTTSVTIRGSWNGWDENIEPLTQDATKNWTITRAFSLNEEFKLFVKGDTQLQAGEWVGMGAGQTITPAGAFVSNGGNFQCKMPGTYKITAVESIASYGDKTYGITIESVGEVAKTHAVTFDYGFAVAGGNTNYTKVETVVDGTTVSAPYASMFGKTVNWNFDFTQPITAPTTITATWEKATTPLNKIYYVLDNDDEVPTHLYAFKDNTFDFGAWPGTPIAEADITTVFHFNVDYGHTANAGRVVKISYPASVTATNFILNGPKKWQTGIKADGTPGSVNQDPILTAGNTYFGSKDILGSADATVALKLLLDVEDARNAVVANGAIKQYSICGIEASKAKAFYDRYVGLTAKQKEYVLKSYTYTYGDVDQTNVNFESIMNQLGVLGGVVKNPLNYAWNETDRTATFTIVGVVAAALVLGSALFFLRKKKAK